MKKTLYRLTFLALAGYASLSLASYEDSLSWESIISTPELAEKLVKDHKFHMSYEAAWIKMVGWLAEHNFTFDVIDKSSGLLVTNYIITKNDKHLHCGSFKQEHFIKIVYGFTFPLPAPYNYNYPKNIEINDLDDSNLAPWSKGMKAEQYAYLNITVRGTGKHRSKINVHLSGEAYLYKPNLFNIRNHSKTNIPLPIDPVFKVQCVSSGELEKSIFSYIEAKR